MAKIFSAEVPDLPHGYVVLDVVAVAKCLDEHGQPTMMVRSTESVTGWEAIGMLIGASDMARADLQSDLLTGDFEREEEAEDDEEDEDD